MDIGVGEHDENRFAAVGEQDVRKHPQPSFAETIIELMRLLYI